jgi:hypothetical protein
VAARFALATGYPLAAPSAREEIPIRVNVSCKNKGTKKKETS